MSKFEFPSKHELRQEIFGQPEFGGNSLGAGLTAKTVSDWLDDGRKYRERCQVMCETGTWPPYIRNTAYVLRGRRGRILLSFIVTDDGRRIDGVTD